MANTNRLEFGDDRAKKNPWEEDSLEVAPLAERLAKVLFAMKAPNGYVIGVNGVWGHGKSTLLNFTCEFLSKFNEESETEKVHRIDFRPWMVSGHQDLVVAFFKVLSESLGPRESKLKRLRRKVAKTFSGSSDAVLDAVAKLAVVADIGVTGGVATGAVSIIKRPFKAKLDEFLKEPSLQAAHAALVKQLNESNQRFLVTIDDIDRLSKAEVMSIMQMVKTVGQLPNVVYLLAYDRSKLRDAFDEADSDEGPRYAEKIIQHEIELPQPSRNSLLRMLDREIKFLTGPAPDELRWYKLISSGVHRWIVNPRDVLLLTNGLKFSWPALEGEIDPGDLLAMEGMRLFDPSVFQWIKENRDFLFHEGRFQYGDAASRQPFFDRFKASISERPEFEQVLDLLSTLFPTLAQLSGNRALSFNERYSVTAARRGIATKAGYAAYFSLSPSINAISKRVVDEVTSVSVSAEKVIEIISSVIAKKDAAGSPMILELLEEVRHRFDVRPPPTLTSSLLGGLFRTSDAIFNEPLPDDVMRTSPRVLLNFSVMELLRSQGQQRAEKLLMPAFRECASVAFCADIYVDAAKALGELDSDAPQHERPFVDTDCLRELGMLLLAKIAEARVNRTLRSISAFSSLLLAWHHLTSNDDAKTWLSEQMQADLLFSIRVVRGLVGRRVSSGPPEYIFSGGLDVELYDANAMGNAIETHLEADVLNDDERYLLRTFLTGLRPPQESGSDGAQS
jgi:hypothetical protein